MGGLQGSARYAGGRSVGLSGGVKRGRRSCGAVEQKSSVCGNGMQFNTGGRLKGGMSNEKSSSESMSSGNEPSSEIVLRR